MSQKLKYNEEKDRYRLHLTHDELVLIAKLVSHVRLGDNNSFSEAAFALCEALDGVKGDNVKIIFSPENKHQDMIIEVS